MRTLRGALAGVLLLTTGIVALTATPAVAAPPSVPYTAFVLDGRDHTSYPLYRSVVLDANNATFAQYPGSTYFRLVGTETGGDYFDVSFGHPADAPFTPGTTYTFGPGENTVGMSLSSTGRACSTHNPGGTFTVHEFARNAETFEITALAVTFSIGCDNVANAMAGEIRWNSTVAYTGVASSQSFASFGTLPFGDPSAPKNITFTSGGSSSAVFGTASLGGAAPGSFAITADGCAGKTLTYGQSCTVSVKATAYTHGEVHAKLIVPDNTVGGNKIVNMSVSGQDNAKGTYYPVNPERVLDTRTGNGAPAAKVGTNQTVSLQVLGRGGVPTSGVSAVVLNVTVTEPETAGHVTVYPSGVAKPTASSLNYVSGWTGANSVTVAVGADGKVNLAITGGKLHLIADVMGFYALNNDILQHKPTKGGRLFTHPPVRIFDSREDWGEKLPGGEWVKTAVGYSPSDTPKIRALVVNVTVTEPNGAGHLRTWNGVGEPPATSTLNFEANKTVPNFAIVPAVACDWYPCGYQYPMIGVFVNQTTHVIVDVVGFIDDGTMTYTDALRFAPQTPERIVDTRINQGIAGRIGQGVTKTVTTPGSIATDATWALALNVTGIQPTVDTNMIVWENGIAKPGVSNLNPAAGQIIPNAAITGIDVDFKFNVYNHGGTIDTVIDVVGIFYVFDFETSAMLAKGATAGKPSVMVPTGGYSTRVTG